MHTMASREEPGMKLSLQQLGIDRLSSAERLELIGLLWDSLDDSAVSDPLPDWHLRELERRRATADANPDAGIPWDVVKARLMREP